MSDEGTHSLMWEPLVCNDDLLVTWQTGLYPSRLPIPEYHISRAITTAYPLPVRRKADLASIAGDGVPCESLLSVLSEVVCAVDEDLVVERLRSEISFWRRC